MIDRSRSQAKVWLNLESKGGMQIYRICSVEYTVRNVIKGMNDDEEAQGEGIHQSNRPKPYKPAQ